MRFEHYSQPVLPLDRWLQRVARSLWLAVAIVVVSLTIGILGYSIFGDLELTDALLESSMILGGMGSIAPMKTEAVKLFASFYALYSGLVIISLMGIILAPWVHRFLHHFHNDRRRTNRGGQKRRASDRL